MSAKKRCYTKTILQDFGPAKKRRICRTVKAKQLWCVFKGKSKIAASCHRKKSSAVRRAKVLQRTGRCKTRIKRGGKR